MLVKVFTIYDSKAEAYLQPFFMKSKGEAIRAITACVEDSQHNFCKYAEDFTLFEIGTFDDSNAFITVYESKQSLGCLLEFKKSQV